MLSEFINKHAKPKCDVILIDPGRGHHAGFSKKMVALGYSHSQIKVDNPENIEKLKKGQVLRYHR